jgi:hypothetical protein
MRTLSLLLSVWLVGSLAQAEGLGTDFSGDAKRIRGVQTLLSTSIGLFTLGGPALRYLPAGKTQWTTLHRVQGDNLYRIASDDSGRLLASWENEKKFHLFVPKTKKHFTFPKPAKSPGSSRNANLDALYFTPDGASVVVYVNDFSSSSTRSTAAYRYRLDGKGAPVKLFHQAGIKLYSSSQAAIFAVLREGVHFNNSDDWPIASIVAYEFSGSQAIPRTLMAGEPGQLTRVQMAGGKEEEGLTMVVSQGRSGRKLFRWRPGQERGAYLTLSLDPARVEEKIFLNKAGELVQIYKMGEEREESLQIKRHTLKGGVKITSLPPLPLGDPDVEQDTHIYAVRERKNDSLFLHWGDFLVLLGEGKPPRVLYIEPLLKRMDEWAGVAIYAADPESLWLGVEVGPGRDFVHLGFDEVEKNAKLLR